MLSGRLNYNLYRNFFVGYGPMVDSKKTVIFCPKLTENLTEPSYGSKKLVFSTEFSLAMSHTYNS